MDRDRGSGGQAGAQQEGSVEVSKEALSSR